MKFRTPPGLPGSCPSRIRWEPGASKSRSRPMKGEPQDPGVEVEAALAVARDSGDVVYAV